MTSCNKLLVLREVGTVGLIATCVRAETPQFGSGKTSDVFRQLDLPFLLVVGMSMERTPEEGCDCFAT